MAPRRNAQAAELMEAEQAEREETADVNEAIARTDSEVFTDALGDEPLDDEAGTELEEMGDGLEGDELEEEGQEEPPPKGQQQAAAPEGDQEPAEEAEGDEGDDAGVEGEGDEVPPQVEQQRPQPSIPPRVLRETRERARENESRLEAQIRDLQMRLDNFARQPQPQQPQPQPQRQEAPSQPPDQFSDPAGHDAWLLAEGERRAQARLENMWQAMQQQQQQQQQRDLEGRLNESLSRTAQGPRSYEFNVAYRDLTSGPQTPDHAALVRGIIAKPDPGQAILDWWEQTSNPDYIEYHRDVVRQQYAAARAQRGAPQRNGNGQSVQNRQVPRHEVRLPRSLSDAAGGRSQHTNDPEMFDGAEESIFAYGARR